MIKSDKSDDKKYYTILKDMEGGAKLMELIFCGKKDARAIFVL